MNILLLCNHFKALLDVNSQVYDDLVCWSANLVVLEEDVGSELSNSLVNHIIAFVVGLRSGTYITKIIYILYLPWHLVFRGRIARPQALGYFDSSLNEE